MAETVQQLVRALADSSTTGLAFEDRSWTWAETVGDAAARAHVLRSWAAPDRPLHVGVLLENTPEMIRALLAGAIGSHVTAGINATRRGEALAADVRRADCQVLLTDSEHLGLLEGLDLGGARVVDTDGAEWAELAAAAPRETTGFAETGAMDTFMLIFTSGTSGEPKAVQVSNFMVVMSGSVLADKYGLTPDDVCYCAMPLFHSNAIMASLAPALVGGSTIALARKFSASNFLADVRGFGATYMNYVGKPLAYVLATPEKPDDADNPLRTAFGNEASDRDIKEFSRRFGAEVWDGFGSTETAVIITRTDDTPLGSIGQPFDGVAVYDKQTRTECPRAVFDANGAVTNLQDCVGELVNTQGAGFFSGYYNDEKATSDRLDGGMYWSGDLAYRDEAGFIYLAGRTDDWLRVDGENLAAAPIEALLLRHPAISQAAVYAVPDPKVGDQLMVTLVLREEGKLDPAGFREFLASQPDLSPKAWPRYVRLATEVPTTATNKILKRALRAEGTATTDPLWERAERGQEYTRMKVAVTGAAGFLGLNVVTALLEEGHDVLAIDRAPGTIPAGAHGSGVLRWESVDVLDEDAMTRVLHDTEVVHHLVAVISLRQQDPLAERVNVHGVGTVARAALRAGVRRMVNCGSLASFDYAKGETVHEGSRRSTRRSLPVYHRSKYYGEVELLKVVGAGLDALTCNPTGIYGPIDHPDRLSRMNQMMLDAARGKLPASVPGEFDMVDVRDVATGFLLAAEKGRTGHNYLIGGHRHDLFDAQARAAQLSGQRGPRIRIPVQLLQTVAPLIDPVARRMGSESFAPAALENIAMSPVVDRTKAGAELGYEPRPVEETIADLVTFFGAAGLL